MDDSASIHEKALIRLCFVCGKMIDLNRDIYDVEKNVEMLSRTLKHNVLFVRGVTPSKFCFKCFCALRKLDRRKSFNVESIQQVSWEECGSSCKTCALLIRGQAGGRKKKVCFNKKSNHKFQLLVSVKNDKCITK